MHFNCFQEVGTRYVMLDKLWSIATPSYTWLTANYLNTHCVLIYWWWFLYVDKQITLKRIRSRPRIQSGYLQEILLSLLFTLHVLFPISFILNMIISKHISSCEQWTRVLSLLLTKQTTFLMYGYVAWNKMVVDKTVVFWLFINLLTPLIEMFKTYTTIH